MESYAYSKKMIYLFEGFLSKKTSWRFYTIIPKQTVYKKWQHFKYP